MARDIFDLWAAVCRRRGVFNSWEVALQPDLQHNVNPNPRIFRSAVDTNIDRARRRWKRAHAVPLT